MPWQNNGDGDKPNPWGGGGGPRRGGGGGEPPHIDEFIKKGQEQLKQAMPGGKGTFSLFLLVLLAVWVVTGFYRVDSNELAVEMRFGKYTTTKGPGLRWHFPYPIETAEVLDVQNQKSISIGASTQGGRRNTTAGRSNLRESLMLTGDENIVDIRFTLVWRINFDAASEEQASDAARNFLFNVRDPEHTIRMVAQGAMREVVGKTPIDYVIKDGKEAVELETKQRVQSILDSYEAGIKVLRVQISVADPPSNVIEYFQDVQKADLDKETYKNEAEGYARKIVPEAEGAAARVVQQAEAYRAQTVARAEGEAARFLSIYNEYVQAKDVTKKRIYLEAMEEILTGMDKIIIDGNGGSGVVPYLPLNELGKKKSGGSE